MEQNQQKSQAVLQCKYCGCGTKNDVIKAAFWTDRGVPAERGPGLTVIEDIPARLCEGCGEQSFQGEVIRRIQKVLTCPIAKAKRQIRVPVYSMSQVQPGKSDPPRRTKFEVPEAFLCKYCQSETVEDLVNSAFWMDGALLAVENIPARLCQRCRQQYYDEQTAERITTLNKRSFATATRDVLVPVFSLSDV